METLISLLAIALGSYFIAAGIPKLLSPETKMPSRFPDALLHQWRNLVRFVALTEIAVGIAILTVRPNPIVMIPLYLGFGTFLTTFGWLSIRETGSCGCSQSNHVTSVRMLFLRNSILFGGLAACSAQGPSPLRLSTAGSPSQFLVIAASLPLFSIAATVLLRRAQQFRQEQNPKPNPRGSKTESTGADSSPILVGE